MNPTKKMLAKAKKTRLEKEKKDEYVFIGSESGEVYHSEDDVINNCDESEEITRYKVIEKKTMVVRTKLELV